MHSVANWAPACPSVLHGPSSLQNIASPGTQAGLEHIEYFDRTAEARQYTPQILDWGMMPDWPDLDHARNSLSACGPLEPTKKLNAGAR